MNTESNNEKTPLKATNPTKKRTYVDAFGERDYEKERYGQEIEEDFFERNVGHGVFLPIYHT